MNHLSKAGNEEQKARSVGKVVAPRIPLVSGSHSRASFVFSLGQTSWEAGGADKAPQAGNSPCAVTASVTRVCKWNYE